MEMMQQFGSLSRNWHAKVTFLSERYIMCMHVSCEQQFYARKFVKGMNMNECEI